MKHRSDHPAVDAQFSEYLRELGLALASSGQSDALEFLSAVLEANEKINLTRITEWDDAVRLHLVDSLAALPELESAPPGAVLDLGSGGGFPGVPLALATSRSFVLLDSVAKKGAAVASVLDSLAPIGSSVSVASGRAEEFGLEHPGSFAAVVARAVAPLPSLVELAAPLLVAGGFLIALKGRPESTERASGSAVGRIVGMKERSWREFRLPGGAELRTIVVYEKVASSKVKLPRRTGLAQHNPLA